MAKNWRARPRWNKGPDTIGDVRKFAANADPGDVEYNADAAAPFAQFSMGERNTNKSAVKRYRRSALYNLIHVGAFIVAGMLSPEHSNYLSRVEKVKSGADNYQLVPRFEKKNLKH